MERANKVVRVKFIYDNDSYENKLMTYKQYTEETRYSVYGKQLVPNPYKWWQLQRFFTIQAFKIAPYFKKEISNALSLKSKTSIILSSTIFIIESIIAGVIYELFTLLLKILYS